MDRDSYAHELKDFFFTFLELPKFNKTIAELSTMEDKWMYFFKHATQTSEEELEKITGPDMLFAKRMACLMRFLGRSLN